MGLVAHLWCDEAAAIRLTALLAQAEDVGVNPRVHWSVLEKKGQHLVLTRRAAGGVREHATRCARDGLRLVEHTRVARDRRVVVALASGPSCAVRVVFVIHKTILGEVVELIRVACRAVLRPADTVDQLLPVPSRAAAARQPNQ